MALPASPVSVDLAAPGVERIGARVANIELLCNAVHREIILLGRELSDCKWSGDYLLDPIWDDPANSGEPHTWDNWLKLRSFVLRQESGETSIDHKKAANMMAWSSCYATIAAENHRREQHKLLPLPLPTNHSQIQPFQALFDRVDDWTVEEWPDDVKAVAHGNVLRDTQPPYAEEQPRFLAKWEEIVNTMPVDKRQTRDGLMAPPPRNFSQNYLTREAEIVRKKREAAEAAAVPASERPPVVRDAITVGKKKQSTGGGGYTAPPKAPKKSKEQLEAEAKEAALRKDIQDYRNGLHNLRSSADTLETILQNILVRGGDARLALMRTRTDLGIYSVHDDLDLLRGAVETCQRVFTLATQPYVQPAPLNRDDAARNATVDVEAG